MKGGRRTTWKGDGGQHGASRSTQCLPKASSSWDKPACVPCPSLSTKTLPSSLASLGGPDPCPFTSIPSRRTLPKSFPHLHPPQEDPTHASSPAPSRGPYPCPLISIPPRRTLSMSSPHLHPLQEDPTHTPLSPAPPRGLYPCPFHPQPLWEDPRCPPSPAHQPGTLCKEHNIESLRDKAHSPLRNGKGSELAPNHAPMWGFAASPRSCPLPSV